MNAESKETGIASFYFKPQNTASGKWFTPDKPWCAHRTLPLHSKIKVTNLDNGKSVIVTVMDRGPAKRLKDRIVDLSRSAFKQIANTKDGLCRVEIEKIDEN